MDAAGDRGNEAMRPFVRVINVHAQPSLDLLCASLKLGARSTIRRNVRRQSIVRIASSESVIFYALLMNIYFRPTRKQGNLNSSVQRYENVFLSTTDLVF